MKLECSAYHPTDRPNFVCISIGPITVYFSYQTPIAFKDANASDPWHWHVRKNDWGPTTGKHLNYIDQDASERIDGVEFERLLSMAIGPSLVIQEQP